MSYCLLGAAIGILVGATIVGVMIVAFSQSGTLYVEQNADNTGYFLYLRVSEEVLNRILQRRHVHLSLRITRPMPSRFSRK